VFLLVVGPLWLGLATDTAVVLRDFAAVVGRYIPSWLTATKTAHRRYAHSAAARPRRPRPPRYAGPAPNERGATVPSVPSPRQAAGEVA
jgi:hypothetical protein